VFKMSGGLPFFLAYTAVFMFQKCKYSKTGVLRELKRRRTGVLRELKRRRTGVLRELKRRRTGVLRELKRRHTDPGRCNIVDALLVWLVVAVTPPSGEHMANTGSPSAS
jgi:hypothetical protein